MNLFAGHDMGLELIWFGVWTDRLTLCHLGFLRVARLGGWKVPAAYNPKTINDNEMKFDGVVNDHWLINLVWFS